MGALFINFWYGHYVNAGVWAQVFRAMKILLGKIFIRCRKEPFFETGGKVSANNRSQMSGNPVKIRDGCATVTATNSNATGNGKAE
jgi:hypothetical protein